MTALELDADQQAKVLAFINQRPEYVQALRNSRGAGADYHRWSGHAEARRQLATVLGLTVPHEHGQHAVPAVATATALVPRAVTG
jgi:hypothetical protein